jgi:hypothetical protein
MHKPTPQFLAAMAVLFVLAMLIFTAPSWADKAPGTPLDERACIEGGGCMIVTRNELVKLVNAQRLEAFEQGKAWANVTCGKRTNFPFDDYREQ